MKRIALIAHDHMKDKMIEWCSKHRAVLARPELCGTGTTAARIRQETGLDVKGYKSGPLGGDLQIGCAVAEGRIDIVIFFSDPLTAQPHDPDIRALLRACQVCDIPLANNPSTADYIVTSPLLDK